MEHRPRIAAILTVYRPLSHADVIVTKFLRGFPTDQGLVPPRSDIVSMYVDQFPDDDMSRSIGAEFGVPIFGSIRAALTLGGEDLAVDGVLLIGEHGDYAWNEREQQLYPRKYFMEQICGVFATSKRTVPIFNDKHLSWNWADARWMVDRARELGAPFMAGSSVVNAWRNPPLAPPVTPIHEAVAVSYSGLDIYGFHVLEALQCMVEARDGAETGVTAVTCLEGEAVWEAGRSGLYDRRLLDAALDTIPGLPEGGPERHAAQPAVFLVEYADGLRGAAFLLTGYLESFAFAARCAGDVVATEIYLQDSPPHGHFSYLSLNVEEMFLTGRPSYPVERTLLTTGILEAALESRYRGHVRLETPHLGVRYGTGTAPWQARGSRPGSECRPYW